ncbi:MAG: GNAT family N-acetyltransferase [Planctomycetota bacterium]|jgi:GNAT superfamily N-acetyltransferase
MYWRRPRGGELWDQKKGRPNRDAFRRLVKAGRVFGALAFVDATPVGWCCLGPRGDFPRLERTKALTTDWDQTTWSMVCFFVKSCWRGSGVAGKLLETAIEVARSHGAARLEAYPVAPKSDKPVPAAFAWTGVPALFVARRFRPLPRTGFSRDVYVLDLVRRSGRA